MSANETLSPAVVQPRSLAVANEATALNVQQVLGQIALVQQVMAAAMKDGEHYGKIPGCGNKPSLLKPGAEKLCLTFRMRPNYRVDERALDGGHREYSINCELWSLVTSNQIGQGVGTCSTMEGKYRFRTNAAEATDKPVPRSYWDVRAEDPAKAQELIGGKGFSVKKVDGKGWMIAKGGEKQEHDNPADHYNTVLKMAKKRALVDAVLTATAASDIFTQDLEDITANLALAGANQAAAGAHPDTTSNESGRSVHTGANASGRSVAPAAAPLADEEAWNIEIHFGKNKGKTLRSLKSNQREYYFGEWLQKGDFRSDADRRLAAAIRKLAPLPGDEQVIDVPAEVVTGDFREVRVHFGKNRGLMLSELSPQQIHWYENDWMPKKEVNGPTSVEDLALVNALRAYSAWRSGQRPPRPAQVRGGQAAARPADAHDDAPPWQEPAEDAPDIPF